MIGLLSSAYTFWSGATASPLGRATVPAGAGGAPRLHVMRKINQVGAWSLATRP